MPTKKTTTKKRATTKKKATKKSSARAKAIHLADGIPVHCAHSKIVAIGSLKPNPGNPNNHPEHQVELLAKIISGQGWRNPIVISKRSGLVVKGHCRLMAAVFLGVKEVPIDEQDYKTESSEHADLIADNRIAELAEIDQSDLAAMLETIDIEDIDIEMTGFGEDEIDALLKDALGGGNYEGPPSPVPDNTIRVAVPAKCFDLATKWMANGEEQTPAGLGIGILKRAKIRY